jgi:hypothetical protein
MRRIATTLGILVTAAALVLAGCGGASAPALDDPVEILVKSVETVQDAKSVHLKLELDGTLPLDLAGGLLPGGSGGTGGSSGGSLDIGGTTIEGDVDIVGQAAQISFSLPALLNISGEVILVDEAVFVKASLLGDKYQVFDGADAGGLIPGMGSPGGSASPGASGSPAATDPIGEFRTQLEGLATPPVKLPDEKCGDTDCYRVQVKLDQADAEPLASLAPDVAATATLDVWVRKNDLRPAQLTITADATDAGDSGNVTATLGLSRWDEAVDIKAPPDDQVEEGSLPGFGLPSPTP